MKKIHRILFFLLLLLLPVQLGRHFWPEFALVFGIRIDYLSPTIYLTDLLVIGILVSWGWEKEAEEEADRHDIQLWDFREILREISDSFQTERTYFTDDTLRTLQLFARTLTK